MTFATDLPGNPPNPPFTCKCLLQTTTHEIALNGIQIIIGDMLPFGVMPGEGNGWVVAAGSYLCGTANLTVTARFAGCQVSSSIQAPLLTYDEDE